MLNRIDESIEAANNELAKQVAKLYEERFNLSNQMRITDIEFNVEKNRFFMEVNSQKVVEVYVTFLGDIVYNEDFWDIAAQNYKKGSTLTGKQSQEFISVMVNTFGVDKPFDDKKVKCVTFVIVNLNELDKLDILKYV
jgi:hypothetical protein